MKKIVICDNFRLSNYKADKNNLPYFLALNVNDYPYLELKYPQYKIKFIEDFINLSQKKKISIIRNKLNKKLYSFFYHKKYPNIVKYDQNYYFNFIDLYITSKFLVKNLKNRYELIFNKSFFDSKINNYSNANQNLVDHIFKCLKKEKIKFSYKYYYKNFKFLSNLKLYFYFFKRNVKTFFINKKEIIINNKKNLFIINFREVPRFINFINYKKNLDLLNACDSFQREGFVKHELYLKFNFFKVLSFFSQMIAIAFSKSSSSKKDYFIKINKIHLIKLIFRWSYYYNYYCNCVLFFKKNDSKNRIFSTNLTDIEIALMNKAAKESNNSIISVPHSPYDLNLFKNTLYDKIISYSKVVTMFFKLNNIPEKKILKLYDLDLSKRYKFKKKTSSILKNRTLIFTDFASFYQTEFNFKNLILLLEKLNNSKKKYLIKLHPLFSSSVDEFKKNFSNLKFLNVFEDPKRLIFNSKKTIFVSSSIISGIELTKNNKYLKKKTFFLNMNPMLNKKYIKIIQFEKIKNININNI